MDENNTFGVKFAARIKDAIRVCLEGAEASSETHQWREYCAKLWVEYLNDRERALQCLQYMESSAASAVDWLCCASSRHEFGLESVSQAVQAAEDAATTYDDWIECAKFWYSVNDKGAVRRCVECAKSLVKDADEWTVCADIMVPLNAECGVERGRLISISTGLSRYELYRNKLEDILQKADCEKVQKFTHPSETALTSVAHMNRNTVERDILNTDLKLAEANAVSSRDWVNLAEEWLNQGDKMNAWRCLLHAQLIAEDEEDQYERRHAANETASEAVCARLDSDSNTKILTELDVMASWLNCARAWNRLILTE